MSFGSRSLPPPTADEARRIEACKRWGCIACYLEGMYSCGAVEYHHLLSGGLRIGHRFGIPLGTHHHRASPRNDNRGPSLADGSKKFHAEYGSDQFMLDTIDDLIGWPRAVIPTKRRKGKTDSPAKCKIGAIK